MLAKYGFLDYHKKNKNAPLVPISMQPRMVSTNTGKSILYTFNAQPDYCVNSYPGLLELKHDSALSKEQVSRTDCEGLKQCLERLIPLIYRQSHLLRINSFVMTSRRIWFLSAHASRRTGKWNLHMKRMAAPRGNREPRLVPLR